MLGIVFYINLSAEQIEWEHVESEHFSIDYFSHGEHIEEIGKQLEEIYYEISPLFLAEEELNNDNYSKISVAIYDDATYLKIRKSTATAAFNNNQFQLNIEKYLEKGRRSTLAHEIVHAFTNDDSLVEKKDYPMWLVEGVAMYYQSGSEGKVFGKEMISEAIKNDQLVGWSDMVTSDQFHDGNRKLNYTEAMWIYSYLVDTYGEKNINGIFNQEGDFVTIFRTITGKEIDEVEKEWQEYIRQAIYELPRSMQDNLKKY